MKNHYFETIVTKQTEIASAKYVSTTLSVGK